MSGFDDIANGIVGLTGSVFGKPVDYTPYGGSLISIQGVFTNAFIDIDGISTLKPVLRIKLSDLQSSPGKGDTVVISTVSYNVTASHPDGFGGTTLILQKA